MVLRVIRVASHLHYDIGEPTNCNKNIVQIICIIKKNLHNKEEIHSMNTISS